MTETDLNEECIGMLREAFKRSLREHLGPINEKPLSELRAWSLALLELATEVREQRLAVEDELQMHADNQPKTNG